MIILRDDLEASVEWIVAELKVKRMLKLEDLERRLEAEKKWSQELSSITEKVKVQHQKGQADLEAARCLVEES